MPEVSLILTNLTAGELSPRLNGRVDISKYFNGCKTLENMLVFPHGGATMRPGTYFAYEVLGRGYCVNGGFDADTDWTKEDGWTITGGKAVGVPSADWSAIYQTIEEFVEGELYEFTFTLSDCTAGSIRPEVGNTQGTARTEDGTYTETIACGALQYITLRKSADFNGKVDDVQVRRAIEKVRLAPFEFSTIQTYILEFTDRLLRFYKDGGIIMDGDEPYEIATPYLEDDIFQLKYVQSADVMYIVHPSYAPRKLTRTGHTSWTLTPITFTAGSGEEKFDAADHYPACLGFYEERFCLAATNDSPQTIWFSQSGDWENFTLGVEDSDAIEYSLAADRINVIRWLVPQSVLLIGTVGGEWRTSASTIEEPITPTNVVCKRQGTRGSQNIQAELVNDVILFSSRNGRKIRELAYSLDKDGFVSPDMTLLAEHITSGGITCMAYQQDPNSILWCVRSDGTLIGMTYEREQDVVGWHRHITDGKFESVAVISSADEDEIWVSVKREIGGKTRTYVEYFKQVEIKNQADHFLVDSGLTFDGGPAVNITGATQTDPVVITVDDPTFDNDDKIKILDVEGMTELNGRVYVLAGKSGSTYQLLDLDEDDIDGTEFSAYESGGTAQKVAIEYDGLDHLIGKEVSVMADGAAHPSVTVDTEGKITLSIYANKVHAGLPYTAKLETMNIEAQISGGTAQGKTKRIHKAVVRLHETLGCKVGPDEDHLETVPFRTTDDPMGFAPVLFTGDKEISYPGDYQNQASVVIIQEQPLPLTVLAIILMAKIYE